MIAKAIPASVGVGGLVDYLYDGRETERKQTDKKAEMILHSDNISVPVNAQDREGRADLKADFKYQESLSNSKDGANVGMHILSFTSDDMKNLYNEQIKQITKDYVEMAGLNDTQFIAIAHNDTNNYHIHIVHNKINNNGKKLDAWQEQNKTVERGVAISLNHNIALKGDSFRIGQTKVVADLRKNHPSVLQLKLNDSTGLLKDSKSTFQLKELGQKNNVKVMSYNDQTAYLKANNLKLGDIPKEQRVEFNKTMVGDKQYRNEDINAMLKGNLAEAQSQKAQRKQDFEADKKEQNEIKELAKILFPVEKIPEKTQNLESPTKVFNLELSNEKEKNALIKKTKIPSFKIKIEKIEKSKGIKR